MTADLEASGRISMRGPGFDEIHLVGDGGGLTIELSSAALLWRMRRSLLKLRHTRMRSVPFDVALRIRQRTVGGVHAGGGLWLRPWQLFRALIARS